MKKNRPTVLDLERMARGEKVPGHSKTEPGTATAVRALKKDHDAILKQYPAEAMFRQMQAKEQAKKKKPILLYLPWAAGPLAAAAMFAVVFMRPGTGPVVTVADPAHGVGPSHPATATVPMAREDVTRTKGLRSHLALYRRTPTGVERLLTGSPLKAREQVQLAFVRENRDQYGLILSVDGRGTTTWHWPETPGTLGRFTTGTGEVLLPKGYELDDAPKFERFFFFTAAEPFDAAAIQAAVENLARKGAAAETENPSVPASVQMNSFLVKKQ